MILPSLTTLINRIRRALSPKVRHSILQEALLHGQRTPADARKAAYALYLPGFTETVKEYSSKKTSKANYHRISASDWTPHTVISGPRAALNSWMHIQMRACTQKRVGGLFFTNSRRRVEGMAFSEQQSMELPQRSARNPREVSLLIPGEREISNCNLFKGRGVSFGLQFLSLMLTSSNPLKFEKLPIRHVVYLFFREICEKILLEKKILSLEAFVSSLTAEAASNPSFDPDFQSLLTELVALQNHPLSQEIFDSNSPWDIPAVLNNGAMVVVRTPSNQSNTSFFRPQEFNALWDAVLETVVREREVGASKVLNPVVISAATFQRGYPTDFWLFRHIAAQGRKAKVTLWLTTSNPIGATPREILSNIDRRISIKGHYIY